MLWGSSPELSQQPSLGAVLSAPSFLEPSLLASGRESKAPYAKPALPVNHFQLASSEQLDKWWRLDVGNSEEAAVGCGFTLGRWRGLVGESHRRAQILFRFA